MSLPINHMGRVCRSVDITIDNSSPDYIAVALTGAYDVQQLEKMMVQVRNETAQSGKKRILVDATELDQPRIDFDRFRVGVALASHTPPQYKVACFLPAEAINHFGEHTAVNRGARYKVFADKQSAVEWLMTSP